MEGTDLNWRTSSYSGNGGGECVEVSKTARVFVRDTQDRTGPVLVFSTAAWEHFADQVKRLLATETARREHVSAGSLVVLLRVLSNELVDDIHLSSPYTAGR
jgi:hypothetical protein